MGNRSARVLLLADMAVLVAVCAVYFLHALGLGLYPEGMESWLESNQWPLWTAAALTVPTALAVALLGQLTQRPGAER